MLAGHILVTFLYFQVHWKNFWSSSLFVHFKFFLFFSFLFSFFVVESGRGREKWLKLWSYRAWPIPCVMCCFHVVMNVLVQHSSKWPAQSQSPSEFYFPLNLSALREQNFNLLISVSLYWQRIFSQDLRISKVFNLRVSGSRNTNSTM